MIFPDLCALFHACEQVSEAHFHMVLTREESLFTHNRPERLQGADPAPYSWSAHSILSAAGQPSLSKSISSWARPPEAAGYLQTEEVQVCGINWTTGPHCRSEALLLVRARSVLAGCVCWVNEVGVDYDQTGWPSTQPLSPLCNIKAQNLQGFSPHKQLVSPSTRLKS